MSSNPCFQTRVHILVVLEILIGCNWDSNHLENSSNMACVPSKKHYQPNMMTQVPIFKLLRCYSLLFNDKSKHPQMIVDFFFTDAASSSSTTAKFMASLFCTRTILMTNSLKRQLIFHTVDCSFCKSSTIPP